LIRVLLLEDDPNLAKSLAKYLRKHRIDTDIAYDGEEALDLSYENRYDLYLLDINVPLLNGIDLLGQLRASGDTTPAIIISALRDVSSVTKGFIAGADDYVKKPFDPEELLVRIKAKVGAMQRPLRIGLLMVHMEKEAVYDLEGKPLYLGDVQAKLLLKLLRHRPHAVSKEELLELLEKPTDLALRVNISKLKKKYRIPIKSVRGVGYQII